MELPGRRHPPHRGSGRAVPGRWPSCPRARPLRPARPTVGADASWCPARGARAARLGHPAGAHDRRQVQRRRLEPSAHALRDHHAAPRAARGRLRRHPRARAGRPRGRLRRPGFDDRPAGGDLPLLLRERCLEHDRQWLRRQAQAPAPARAHRRLRGRRMDGAALLRRQLPDHPQRGRRPRRASDLRAPPAGRAAAPGLRRPGRRAQGASGAAARLRGAARPRPGRAHHRGRRSRRGRAADARWHAGRHRAGQGLRHREGRRAGRSRPARRALAGRRELRHGPHRGLRRRHTGRRLRHPRLPRRRARRGRRRALPARRRHRPCRDPSRPRGGAPAAHRDGRRGASARAALRLADGRRRGAGGLHRRRRHAARVRPPASAPASSSAPGRPTSGRAFPPSVACRASRPPSARVAIAAARPPARPGSASPGSPPRSWPCSR